MRAERSGGTRRPLADFLGARARNGTPLNFGVHFSRAAVVQPSMRPSLSRSTVCWLAALGSMPGTGNSEGNPTSRLEHRIADSARAARCALLDLLPRTDAHDIEDTLARALTHFERGDEVAMYDIADELVGVGPTDAEVLGHVRALVRQWVVQTTLLSDSAMFEAARVVRGRREVAARARPPITRAIETVLGGESRSIGEILAALEARAWLPRAANPRAYVSQILASRRDRFRRVRRGTYAPVYVER